MLCEESMTNYNIFYLKKKLFSYGIMILYIILLIMKYLICMTILYLHKNKWDIENRMFFQETEFRFHLKNNMWIYNRLWIGHRFAIMIPSECGEERKKHHDRCWSNRDRSVIMIGSQIIILFVFKKLVLLDTFVVIRQFLLEILTYIIG